MAEVMTFQQALDHVHVVISSSHLPGWKQNREAWAIVQSAVAERYTLRSDVQRLSVANQQSHDAYNSAAARAEKAEAELAAAKAGWQPIETAPKDGTLVLTCWKGVDMQVNHFNDLSNVAEGHRLGREAWWCSAPNRQPTHWQPLPPPPAGESK